MHIFAFYCLFQLILAYLCTFIAILSIQMNIMHILQVPWTSKLKAFPVLFQFHFTETASYEQIIASKHTHLRGSGDPRARTGPGRAGAGACSLGPIVRWPVNRLSLHSLWLENLILGDPSTLSLSQKHWVNLLLCIYDTNAKYAYTGKNHKKSIFP